MKAICVVCLEIFNTTLFKIAIPLIVLITLHCFIFSQHLTPFNILCNLVIYFIIWFFHWSIRSNGQVIFVSSEHSCMQNGAWLIAGTQ